MKLKWLQWRARRVYYSMERHLDSVDCGAAMLEEISPSYSIKKRKLDALVERIKELTDE